MAIRIALADDHQLVRKGIRLLLESIDGFKVVAEASNGKELIEEIANINRLPDIALIDVNMPVMDGHETVSVLRAKYPDLRLIALSVNNDLYVIREMVRLGANAYLFKDSSPAVFKTVLHEVLEKGCYYDKQVIESLLLPENMVNGHPTKNGYRNLIRSLSSRELEFIKFCCSELTYKEIADKMNISQRTVDGYRESVFDKLEVKSRTGLVLFAFNAGIYMPEN